MNITRRQLIVASVSATTYAAAGLRLASAADSLTDQVIHKSIPGSGEKIPVVGLGTNRWVAAGSKSEIQGLKATLKVFKEMGGRVIDTAPSYRSSEKALGQIIEELEFDGAFFLATKVDREGKQSGIDRMNDSLEKLGTQSIDLMQVHNLRGAETQLETLREWKAEGTVRYLGATTSRTSQFADLEELMTSMPLDFVQLNYSLRDREAEERLLPIAAERKIAVMVNRPFAHGHLFTAFDNEPLPDWAATVGCKSWAQMFLKYVVSHPAVTCAIPGTTKEHHVRDNMAANIGDLPDQALRQRLETLFASL